MKKYIPIIVIFFVTLMIIFFYIFRNTEIKNSIEKFSELRNLTYEVEVLTYKQENYFQTLDKKNNYDGAVAINRDFDSRFKYFETLIQSTDDTKLENLLYDMNQKRFVLKNIYEDIKTDNAVIKNSQVWLEKSYRKYIHDVKDEELDKKVLLYIFNGVIPHNNIIDTKLKNSKSNTINLDTFNAHLNMIHEKRKSLQSLKNHIQEYSLLSELDKIILYSLKKLHKLQVETEKIITILLITSSFLLAFGFIVYVKEILSANETKKIKNELQQFVDALNASAIVSKTDLRGTITYVNENFCEVSGYTEEELIGNPHNILRHPNMNSEVYANLWNTIQNKNIFKAIIQNRAKNGESYFVDTAVIPLLDVSGKIKEYLSVRYDVTDLVQSRDIVLQAERAKDEFLSNMSHELRTPLNAISGFTAILLRLLKDKKHLRYLKNIADSSNNLIELINSILDLSKLQSGNFSIDAHDFYFEKEFLLLVERFDTLLVQSELTFTKYFDSSIDVHLHGDWLRISQIITNLISNAMKFSPKGETIELRALYENNVLLIEVRDFGIGLSEEAQAKIFKPFEQADSSTTRQYGGTGLGLSIVLNLIEQMEGTITLDSKEGEGSCFSVRLPLKHV